MHSQAKESGGAISGWTRRRAPSLDVSSTVFSNNSAERGGAVLLLFQHDAVESHNMSFVNCSFSHNLAGSAGGICRFAICIAQCMH